MSGPVDGLAVLQWAGIILPTVAVLALFVRLGALLSTVRKLETDMSKMIVALDELTKAVAALNAWRDASKDGHADMLERVRRLEDRGLSRS